MTSEIRCPNCGIRLRAASGRCPRCRFKLGSVAPAVARKASRERAFGRIALSLTAVLAVVLVVIWWQRRPVPVAPVKAQRPPVPAAPAKPTPANAPVMELPVETRQLVVPPELQMSASDAYATKSNAAAVLQQNADDPDALNDMGTALTALGEWTNAIPYLERAMRSDATRWQAPFNLGRVRAQLHDWPAAITLLRQARTLQSSQFAVAYDLGLVLHRSGQDEAAIDEYRQALVLDTSNPDVQRSLGISLERTGDLRGAAQAYEAYLSGAPQAPDAAVIRQRLTHVQSVEGGRP